MRGVLVPGLLLVLAGAGCVSGESMRPRGPARQRLLELPGGPDVVRLDVAVVERRLGDAYINHDLWAATDEQVAGLDNLARLENNGFRVGQVVGSLPSELRAMLKNEHFCINPRTQFLRAGSSLPLALGTVAPSCSFRVSHDGQDDEAEFEQAQCELLVEPALTDDGKTRLRFTPRVTFGEPMTIIEAAAETSEWTRQVKKQSQLYPELSWEVTLAPGESVVIGTHLGQAQSLGYQAFVNQEGAVPIQRLLWLRSHRGAPAAAPGGEIPTAAGQAFRSGSR